MAAYDDEIAPMRRSLEAVGGATDGGETRNILDLVPLWEKIKGSQKNSSLRHMKHYAATFAKIVGNIPVASVTRMHVDTYGTSYRTSSRRATRRGNVITTTSRHYSTSRLANGGLTTIPCGDCRRARQVPKSGASGPVSIRGTSCGPYSSRSGPVRRSRRTRRTRHGSRNSPICHGCRVSEIAQLRKQDIRTKMASLISASSTRPDRPRTRRATAMYRCMRMRCLREIRQWRKR